MTLKKKRALMRSLGRMMPFKYFAEYLIEGMFMMAPPNEVRSYPMGQQNGAVEDS